ncbi:hypothetical protein KKC36_00875, partial [Patescibacteria group bacterium]|nr:hypothetical protein [Patescibacteria group bacterium]
NQQNNETANSTEQINPVSEPVVNSQQPSIEVPVPNQTVNEEKKKNKYVTLAANLWMKLNPALRKVIMITGFIFGLLLLLAIVFSVSPKTGNKVQSTPKPNITVEKSPLPEIIINPSRYATDSAVLAVEEDLKTIEKEIGSTVINDLKLAPPNLLWDVSFED